MSSPSPRTPLKYDAYKYRKRAWAASRTPTEPHTIYLGNADNPIVLDKSCLIGEKASHVAIFGPTRHGKTTLARSLVRPICTWVKRDEATLYADFPKHEDYPAFVNEAALYPSLTNLFDTSSRYVAAFNPFRCLIKNLSFEDNALLFLSIVRGALASTRRQDIIGSEPRRARWMFNAVVPVMEHGGSPLDSAMMLDPHRYDVRDKFSSQNPLIQQEWESFEHQSKTQKEILGESSTNWLLQFCQSSVIKHMFTHPVPFDVEETLTHGTINLSSFKRVDPLTFEHAIFLRSLYLNTVISLAMHTKDRPHLIVVLDEAELALLADSGLLEMMLNEGIGMRVTLILLMHNLTQLSRVNPALLASVLTNCRIKFIGGGMTMPDLDVLIPELFTRWHDQMVRQEIYSPFLMPHESVRDVVAEMEGEGWGDTITTGTALGNAITRSTQEALGESEMWGTHEDRSSADAEGEQWADQHSHTDAAVDGWNDQDSSHESETTPGDTDEPSMHVAGRAAGSGRTGSTISSDAQGSSYARNRTHTDTHSQGTSYALSRSRTLIAGISTMLSETISNALAKTRNHQRARTVTCTPFYEYTREAVLSSRELLSYQDYLTTYKLDVKNMKRGQWMAQFPYRDPLKFVGIFLTAIATNEHVQALLQSCAENPAYADRSKPLIELLPALDASTEEPKEVSLDFGTPKRATDVRDEAMKKFTKTTRNKSKR